MRTCTYNNKLGSNVTSILHTGPPSVLSLVGHQFVCCKCKVTVNHGFTIHSFIN